MKIYNEELHFQTAEELINYFNTSPFFRTNRKWDANTPGRGLHIYRGHADSEWELLPKVFRPHESLENFSPTIADKYLGRDRIDRIGWLGCQLHAELRAVHIFLEIADKIGIETPIDYSRSKEGYELIKAALAQKEYDYSTPFPSNKALEDLALAAHHGIPTRLLDWSESPFVACYFAALEASSLVDESKRISSKRISVVCLHTHFFNETDELESVRAPRHRNNFLLVQKGIFTHMPKANDYLLNQGKWPSTELIISSNSKGLSPLKKYSVPASEADNLLRILFDLGFTKHQLMPTLDNVAQAFSYISKLFT